MPRHFEHFENNEDVIFVQNSSTSKVFDEQQDPSVLNFALSPVIVLVISEIVMVKASLSISNVPREPLGRKEEEEEAIKGICCQLSDVPDQSH